MALDAGDGARLRRIEVGLVHDDPLFVARFRSWRPSSGPGVPPGWSVLPPWVAVVFLIGLTTWMLTPGVGVIVLLVGGLWWLHDRAGARVGAASGERGIGSNGRMTP